MIPYAPPGRLPSTVLPVPCPAKLPLHIAWSGLRILDMDCYASA
ncbi:hypothetical protein [Streptomyces fagopyri]|nr:hypothetical protein [Streptomyces fagopyri]